MRDDSILIYSMTKITCSSYSSEFSLIGLALIALGTGGIKPCVSSFGGDQFKLPEQERQLKVFDLLFYSQKI
jgi:dipeptide/tripeptide permease